MHHPIVAVLRVQTAKSDHLPVSVSSWRRQSKNAQTKPPDGLTGDGPWWGPQHESRPGLNKPTGLVKPARSGNGLPDRFDRKPMETDQIQNQIQNRMFNQFLPVYRPVWLVTG